MFITIIMSDLWPLWTINARSPPKGHSISYLTISVVDTAPYCQLESLSAVDVWLANHFCSIEGFFLFLCFPLKLFSPPGIAGGSLWYNQKKTPNQSCEFLVFALLISQVGQRIVLAAINMPVACFRQEKSPAFSVEALCSRYLVFQAGQCIVTA